MDPITLIILITAAVLIAMAIIWWLVSREVLNTDLVYSEALSAILKGNNTEAIKLLKQVVSKDSDNIGAYLQLGNLLRSVNPKQAIKIHQSLTVRPKLSKLISKEIHQVLAMDYAEIGDYIRAKIEAEMVLKYNKTDLWANQFLLHVAESQNNWGAASNLAKKVHSITGKQDIRQLAMFQLQTGNEQLDAGESKKALQYYQKALKIDQNYSEPYLKIGNIFEEDNNLKKAIINWEKYLINSEDSDINIFKKIESALFEQKRFGEIEQFYTRILVQKPNDKNALVKLATILSEKGEIDKAIELVDKYIDKSDSNVARILKVKILFEKANPIDLNEQLDEIINRVDI